VGFWLLFALSPDKNTKELRVTLLAGEDRKFLNYARKLRDRVFSRPQERRKKPEKLRHWQENRKNFGSGGLQTGEGG
jgi:hypothetical protein